LTEILWDGRIFDPETGTATERRAITIEADTIVAIEAAAGDPPDGAHDLAGATVLPGLIDTHVHLGFAATWNAVAQMEADDVAART